MARAGSDEDMQDEENERDVGIYPDYLPVLDEFDHMIVWKSCGNRKIPEPRKGVDDEFDNINTDVDSIK